MLPQLYDFAASHGAEFTGPPVFVCHEITVEEVMKAQQQGTAGIELAIPIANEIEETDEIKCYTLQGGKMAKITHKGPYEQCQPTYEKLYNWLEQNDWKITGPVREVYLNDPSEVGMEEVITEIFAPID